MRIIALAAAMIVGVAVLLGYFLPPLAPVQTILLNWAVVLTGAATLVGVFNLISVHGEKIRSREKNSIYSAMLILSLVAVLLFGMVLGPGHAGVRVLVNGILLPAEAAFMGLLTVSLIYAAVRLLRRRTDIMSIAFLLSATVVLLGSATLPFGDVPLLGTLIRPWITQVLAVGGARGILIGVALGTVTTGLRILLGTDRPYGGS